MRFETLERSAVVRRSGAMVLLVALLGAMWAFASPPAQAATVTVNAKDFAFSPGNVTVKVGDTVRWVNGDAESHAVQGGSLSSPEILPGESFSSTFTEVGTTEYVCRFHTYMTGTVTVTEAAAAPAAPATTKPAATATTAAGPAVEETTTTTEAVTSGTRGSTFQRVPDDPSARTPPAGDARTVGGPVAPIAADPSPTPSSIPVTPRGAQFQDVPDDPGATHAPGEVHAQSISATRQVPVETDPGGTPPDAAGDAADPGDLTTLAPYEEVDGVKEFHLTLTEMQVEVSPGVTKPAYGFNGQVPGPTIKVDEGDKVRIVVDNQLPFPTSTHWHGMILPNDQDGVGGITQPHIEPGQTYTYEWTAVATGSHWYHAHSSGRHIGKGLYGALQVVPKGGDLEVDEDYTLLLGDTDLGFTINGRSFPSTPVLSTKVGDTVRLRVTNTGDQVHAFHLHGVPFRVVAQDGMPKATPEQMDTLTISPGQTFDLLFEQEYPGDWVIHCHMFIHSHMSGDTHPPGESGMNGMTAIVRAAAADPSTSTPDAAAPAPVSTSSGSAGPGLILVAASVLLVVAFLVGQARVRLPQTS